MDPARNSARSRLAVLFSALCVLVIVGLAGWQAQVIYSGAENLRSRFSSPATELEEALKLKDAGILKNAVEQIFAKQSDLKALRITGAEGILFLYSRHSGLKNQDRAAGQLQPPEMNPDIPWETIVTSYTAAGTEKMTLDFLVTLYDPAEILDALKILIFSLLGVLLAALLVKMALNQEEPRVNTPMPGMEKDFSSEKSEDLDFQLPPWDEPRTDEDLAPLGQQSLAQEEIDEDPEEEFRYDFHEDMESEILNPPETWKTDRLPDLQLPPLDLPPVMAEKAPEPLTRPSGPFDPETGAVWENFLDARLESELRRAADNNQDLVLCLICGEDTLEAPELRQLRNILVEAFPLKDLIFNRNTRGFTLLLPQKTLDAAMKDLDLCLKRKDISSLSSRIVSGMSARSGRLLDSGTLIGEAEKALEKAASGHESLIGFRADPEKYRNFLAKAAKE